MAPSKTKTVRSKVAKAPSSATSKNRSKAKAPPPKQQKTKRTQAPSSSSSLKKKKRKTYSAEELGIPALNGIIPAGVTKPKGRKKGKVFIDDQERMMTILAIVNAEAEGKVESKMMRQRQLEEVREARRLEAEKKESEKKGLLENAKDEIRQKKKRRQKNDLTGNKAGSQPPPAVRKERKSVSFAP